MRWIFSFFMAGLLLASSARADDYKCKAGPRRGKFGPHQGWVQALGPDRLLEVIMESETNFRLFLLQADCKSSDTISISGGTVAIDHSPSAAFAIPSGHFAGAAAHFSPAFHGDEHTRNGRSAGKTITLRVQIETASGEKFMATYLISTEAPCDHCRRM